MSDITDILTEVINLKRETASVLDARAVASLISSVNRQPARSCRLEITIAGATIAAGNVHVTGNNDEDIAFTENGTQVGIVNFTSIASLTLTNIAGGTISVRAVSNMGQPITQEYLVAENMNVRFYARSGHIRAMVQGDGKIAEYKMMAEPDADIQVKDQVYAVSGILGLTLGEVSFVKSIPSFAGVTHHVEAEVKLR